jgi:tetratricopeptide (TPR) repeat protein
MNIIDENNYSDLHNKANYLYKNKKYNKACEIYSELIDNEYKLDIMYSNISAIYLNKKDYHLALYNSLTALVYNINYSIAWGRVGYSYKGLKKNKNALDAFYIAYKLHKKEIYKNEIFYFSNKINNKINKESIFNLLLNDTQLFNKLKELKNDILNHNYAKVTNLIDTIVIKLMDV